MGWGSPRMERKNDLREALDRYALRLKDALNARLRQDCGGEAVLQVEDIQIRLLSAGQSRRQQ